MADSAGDLTFSFGADVSGFSRAIATAGAQLDALRAKAAQGSGPAAPLQLSGAMTQAAAALQRPAAVGGALPSDDDDQAQKTLGHLSDQLALLQSTGAAHDAIVERMTIEAQQAKLGTDATTAQKQAVVDLVTQIDAAKAAQATLATQQRDVNDAWSFGADALTRSLDGILLRGQSLQGAARTLLTRFASQGLSAALTGGGSLAGLFGTAGTGSQTGGLFGALQSLFSSGLGAAGASISTLNSAFSGLYADGGTIGAGQWGIVGEKGAEVVAGPAAVTPWSKVPKPQRGAGSTTHQTITFNVTSPDAPSFMRSESQVAALLSRAVGRGQRNS